MPSATPVPRGPSVLALGSAAELLARPGCPVCRYAAEASDRYLAWFAIEAHADPVTITRLCASLGMCARHTRGLMSQPGAAARLTAVYRYLLQDAGERLGGTGRRPLAACPACEHDQDAAGRALDTLLGELPDAGVRERYTELGGLCWPHARAAAGTRGHRRAAAWIMQVTAVGTGRRASLDVLAGGPDHDAELRARLRAALPPAGRLPPGTCPACLAAARAELAELAGLARAGTGGGRRPEDAEAKVSRQERCLCPGHLRDVVLASGDHGEAWLGWQAECQAVVLARLAQPPAWRRGGGARGGWVRARSTVAVDDSCPVCRAREQAARQELRGRRTGPQASPGGASPLCVRHVLAWRVAEPAAGTAAAATAAKHAGTLIEELTEAFRKGTWAFRHESRGTEMTAWRRAAAFLDGGVFGGCPPG